MCVRVCMCVCGLTYCFWDYGKETAKILNARKNTIVKMPDMCQKYMVSPGMTWFDVFQ